MCGAFRALPFLSCFHIIDLILPSKQSQATGRAGGVFIAIVWFREQVPSLSVFPNATGQGGALPDSEPHRGELGSPRCFLLRDTDSTGGSVER